MFNWCQNYIDAPIYVPEDSISSQLQVNWEKYTEWNLVKLTQNYLRLILRYLSDSNNGLLIHCISGTDIFYYSINISKMDMRLIYYLFRLGPHTAIYFIIEN